MRNNNLPIKEITIEVEYDDRKTKNTLTTKELNIDLINDIVSLINSLVLYSKEVDVKEVDLKKFILNEINSLNNDIYDYIGK